jgi:hypothetical protein
LVRPKIGTSLDGNASFEPLTMEISSPVRPVEVSKKIIRKERKRKKRKTMHKMSQKCYISRSQRVRAPGKISMTIESLVQMINLIDSAEFDHCMYLEWFELGEDLNLTASSCQTLWLIQQG